jgi:type I restriction enzyme S subunit
MTDWPVKTLGEVCEVLDNLRKPITKRDRTSGDYPYYGATGIVDYVGDYIFDERLVLVGEDGAKWGAGERTAFIAEDKYWVNNHAHVLRCKQGVLVDSWLANFLTMSDLNRYVSGLTVPKLNQGSLVSIENPVPPLDEQNRIVALLDAATARVTELRDIGIRRSKLETEIRSAFIDELLTPQAGWTDRALSEWCIDIDTGPFGSLVHKADYVETGIPLVNPMNIKEGRIIESGIKRVSPRKALELKRHIVQTGDIVLGRRGEMGRCAVVRSEQNGWICGTGSFVLRPSEECNPDLLALWISSRKGRIALSEISSGTTMDNLGNRELGLLRVSFPDRSTQDGLVARALAFEELAADMEVQQLQRSKQLASLQQSILQAAFVGEL